jgi:hypothetical protein
MKKVTVLLSLIVLWYVKLMASAITASSPSLRDIQPGRGQSDAMVGAPPVNRATGKVAWPHQALEPSYSWNDIYTPTGDSVNFKTGGRNHKLRQEGRDYYNNTQMPGYKPYTYPHPLVSGGASKHAQSGKLDDRPASTREWKSPRRLREIC